MEAILEQWEEEEKSRGNEEVKMATTGFLLPLGIKNKTNLNH